MEKNLVPIQKPDVAIIGAGPAGISAAIWCKRLGLSVLLIEKKKEIGGQLHQIHNRIIDYPGLITENGLEMLTHFSTHLHSLHIPIMLEHTGVQIDDQKRQIITMQGHINPRYVILATGSQQRRLHIPGEEEMLSRGEIYSTNRDLNYFQGKNVLVVGGGDRAFESAYNLADVAKSILLIHRSDVFRARKEFIKEIENHPKVSIKKFTVLQEIFGNNKVEGVKLRNLIEERATSLPMDVVLIRIGVQSLDEIAPKITRRTENGLLEVDRNGRTSIPWLFAIGDVVTPSNYASISLAVGDGMRAAKSILQDIRNKIDY